MALFCSMPAYATIQPLNKMVAVVNNALITQNEVNQKIKWAQNQNVTLSSQQALEELITEQIQLQRAAQMGLGINDAAMDHLVADIAKQNNMSVPQLRDAISRAGLVFESYKEELKTQQILAYLRQKEVLESIEVTEQEINQFLSSAVNVLAVENAQNAQYRIGHILIALDQNPTAAQLKKASAQAQAVLKKLKANEAVPIKDLGWRKTVDLPTILVDIMPALHKNDTHGPIQTESGFHIFKLLDKHAPQETLAKNPTEQKKQIEHMIKNRKAKEKIELWIQKLRDTAYIQNYLDPQSENNAHRS